MTRVFSKESLALHVGGDLPAAEAVMASHHLQTCRPCRQFFDQLQERQSLLKGLRQEAIGAAALKTLRREVMSTITGAERILPWNIRMERFLMSNLQRHKYAFAAVAMIAVVSISLLAQIRIASPAFDADQALLRPDGYRDWVLVGGSFGAHETSLATGHKVYIDRSAYLKYTRTGAFPEGTMLVLESTGTDSKIASGLQASVKDRRFQGGWGFFNFTGPDGKSEAKASAQPAASCRSCHEERAGTDHVFTQFYPGLNSTT